MDLRTFNRQKINVLKREENQIEFIFEDYRYIGTVISESINGNIKVDVELKFLDNNNIV